MIFLTRTSPTLLSLRRWQSEGLVPEAFFGPSAAGFLEICFLSLSFLPNSSPYLHPGKLNFSPWGLSPVTPGASSQSIYNHRWVEHFSKAQNLALEFDSSELETDSSESTLFSHPENCRPTPRDIRRYYQEGSMWSCIGNSHQPWKTSSWAIWMHWWGKGEQEWGAKVCPPRFWGLPA